MPRRADLHRMGHTVSAEVLKVDGQPLAHIDEDRLCPDTGDCAGHRRQGEAVRQDPVPRADADRAQRAGHGVSARGHREAVFRTGEGREFLFEQRGFARLARHRVVAVQAA